MLKRTIFTWQALLLIVSFLAGCSQRDSTDATSSSQFTQEFRYYNPGAGEVILVWGVNGWNILPEAELPAGTVIMEGLMRTQMTREGDAFTARFSMPPWTTINYGFMITRSSDGSDIEDIWDGKEDYHIITSEKDTVTEVMGSIQVEQIDTLATSSETSSLSQGIQYRNPEAGEVLLVWGINGWGLLPEADWPAGTFVENDLMQTPMVRDGDVFVTQVRVPAGVTINYGFLITKTSDGTAIEPFWDGGEGFSLIATEHKDLVKVESQASPDQAVHMSVQEFRYRNPEAGEVLLVWGINGWGLLPEADWPAGTFVENDLMQTPMVRDGDVFVTQVRVPAGVTINYGFLITKTSDGTAIANVWDGNEGQSLVSSESNQPVAIQSSVSLRPAGLSRTVIFGLVFLVAIGIVILISALLKFFPSRAKSGQFSIE